MNNNWKYTLFSLSLLAVLVWAIALSSNNHNLKIIACDVGQGDAFLIQVENTQVLVDGGPNNKVLDCLSSNMPFWDKTIEIVVLTHPQHDHYFGLIKVLDNYQVKHFLYPEADNSAQGYQVLKNSIGGSDIDAMTANMDTSVRLGLMSLDILHPTSGISSSDLNDYSIVFNLNYKNFNALFTGDIGPKITTEIVNRGELEDINYLKIPHHGSKNGLSLELLEATKPELAIISAGKSNRFGHPHKEVTDLLETSNVTFYNTASAGQITTETNGNSFWVVK